MNTEKLKLNAVTDCLGEVFAQFGLHPSQEFSTSGLYSYLRPAIDDFSVGVMAILSPLHGGFDVSFNFVLMNKKVGDLVYEGMETRINFQRKSNKETKM